MFWLNLSIRGFIFAVVIVYSSRFLFNLLREIHIDTTFRRYKFSIAEVLLFTLFCAMMLAVRSQIAEVWSCRNDLIEGFSAMLEPFRVYFGCPKLPNDFCFSPEAKHTLVSDGLLATEARKTPIIMASLGAGFAMLSYMKTLHLAFTISFQVLSNLLLKALRS